MNKLYLDPSTLGSSADKEFSEPKMASWYLYLWQRVDQTFIAGFTPVYYASVMGTGISSNILYNFPFESRWLQVCGIIMAVVALCLFLVLLAFFALALLRNKSLFSKIHRDAALAPPMGCFVMGYITLVNMLHSLTKDRWIMAVWVLWWIAVAGSFYTAFLTFYLCAIAKHRKNRNHTEPSNISMTFLLPVVTLMVTSSSGGIVTPDLPHLQLKIISMVVSFIMWAIAVVLAFIVVSVNFWRLFVHKIPASGQVFTMFLPIGFLGQGSYSILLFGRNCVTIIMEHADSVLLSSYTSILHTTASENHVDLSGLPSILATSLLTVSTLAAMTLVSFGYFFTFVAFASFFSKMVPFASRPNLQHVYQPSGTNFISRQFAGFLRFNKGFWSMTFPVGTMVLANGEIHSLFNGMEAFRYISVIYAVVVIIVTLGCLCGVLYNIGKAIKFAFSPLRQKEMV